MNLHFSLFGADRMRRMVLVALPLLLALGVFGPVPAADTGQAPPSFPAKDISGFRAFFLQVTVLDSLADRLKAQGKDDNAVRGAIQKDARLTAQETSLLKEIAPQCNAAEAAQASSNSTVISGLRQQYPPVAGTAPPAAVTQKLAALQAQRDAIIAGCIQQLKVGMGTERFLHLDLFVLVHVAGKQKQVQLQPPVQGTAAPR